MKRLFLILSLVSLAVGIGGFIAWSQDLLPGSGGGDWARWNTAIHVTWILIQVAFPASVLFGIAYLVVKPRSRNALAWGLSVIAIAVATAAAILFLMSHLSIG